MRTLQKLIQTTCRTLTSSVRAFHAKASAWLAKGSDSGTIQEELSSSRLPESLKRNGLHFFSWKTFPDCYRMTEAGRCLPSSPRLLNWGMISNGVCITARFSESPSSGAACILSDILETNVPELFPLNCGNAEDLKQLIPGPQGQRVYDPSGSACTQCAGSGGWGGKTGLYFIDMNPDPVITDQARCITARQDSGISNHRGEHSGVIVVDDEDEPRAVLTPDRETVRQQGRRVKEPNEAMFTLTAQDRHGVWHRGRIRKLMPIECWRLQGFTDEQFYKAQATGLKDGHLYKMAGNAVSVPVISAIGRKLLQLDEIYHLTKGRCETW